MTFDATGVLTSPAAGAPVNLTSPAFADGANALNVNWNLFDPSGNPLITQFASASATLGTTQDGVQAAMVTGTSLQDGGLLVATFSDGTQRTVAQLALASISNPDSLIAVTNNQYSLGANSATPTTGAAGTGTRGQVVGGSLESSNVDMATQLTNLIVYQRAYQANSKSITSIDQMQQTLIALTL
jgi:flagellar hook protein FlgE